MDRPAREKRVEPAVIPAEASRPPRRPDALTLVNVLLVLLAAFWFARNDADADLWGHIQYGEDLLRTGVVPTTDPYSYTAEDLPWINHEILAEVALALLFRLGNWAIVAWKLGMGLAVIFLAYRVSKTQERSILAWLLLASLIQYTLALGWGPRPQIFSYLFFAMLLAILHQGERRPAALWLVVPLMAVWTNSHGGFLLGLACFGFYLITKVVLELRENGALHRGRLASWVLLGLAAVAATLVNPYGPGIYEGVFRELGIQRTQVREWAAVYWLSSEWGLLKILMLLTIAGLAFSRKPMPIYQRVLLIVVLVEAQLHVRHVVFLAIAALAWLPGPFQNVWARGFARLPPRWWAPGGLPTPPRWLVALAAAAALFLGGAVATRLATIRVDRRSWPVDAFEYIAQQDLKGKLVVPFNWAQYAIFTFYPDLRVSFDGRYGTVYSNEILDMNFDLIYPVDPRFRYRSPDSPPYDPTRVLSYRQPNLVLVQCGNGTGFPQACDVMESAKGWVRLYQDPIARIYGLASVYASAESLDFIPENVRVTRSEPLSGWVPFPATPASREASR